MQIFCNAIQAKNALEFLKTFQFENDIFIIQN